MRITVRKELTYNLPKRIIGDRKGSFDEWVVWVEYVDESNYMDPDRWGYELKFFFDVEHEADWYKRDLEKLMGSVLRTEHKRIEEKFKKWLLSYERE